MNSLFRFRWLALSGICVYALQACSNDDSITDGGPGGSSGGSPSTGGMSGTSGSGGSDIGGIGGEGDDDSGGTGGGHAGEGGVPGGTGGTGGIGGEGGAPVDPVSVVSAVLPDATLNQDYRFVFEANGGSGEGYAFTLDRGALPRGLAIAEDGTLSGIPLEGGDFELELVVTDSGDRTARVALRLHVRQSRWLAYWNVLDGNVLVPRFSVIDLASNGFVRRDIAGNNLPGSLPDRENGPDASQSGFSPDGRFAVYAVFVHGEHDGNEFRLIDFDRFNDFDWGDPEPPRSFIANNLGEELVQMYGPMWSPDSKRLAVTALIENAAHDIRSPGRFGYFDIDVVLTTPEVPEASNLIRRPEGASTNTVDWVSNGTVVYQSQGLDMDQNVVPGNMVRANWQGNEFTAPVTLLGSNGEPFGESYYVHYVNHATRKAVIARHSNPHCVASIELYDFTNDGVVNLGEDPLLPAPELDRFAGVSASTLKIVDAQNQPLATLEASDCNLIAWSPDGAMLAWVDTTEKTYKVTKLGPNGAAVTLPVANFTYATSADRPQLSSDGRWVAYRADNNLYVARIGETAISDAMIINVALVDPMSDRIGSFQFSPNGRAVVYAAAGRIAGLEDLYLVDLSSETPGMSRRISPDLSGFPDGDVIRIPPPESDQDEYMERRYPTWDVWTPDSSKVFFVVRDWGGQLGDALFVVDVLAARPTPVQVDVGACDSRGCGTLSALRAQPPR